MEGKGGRGESSVRGPVSLVPTSPFAHLLTSFLSAAAQMVETETGPRLDPSLAAYSVHDDNKVMREICAKIGAAEGKVVIESELKQVSHLNVRS